MNNISATFRGVALITGNTVRECDECLLEEIRYALRRNIASHSEFHGKSLQTETTRSEFANGVKAVVKQILESEEINK